MDTKRLDEKETGIACWCGASSRMRAAFWGGVLILLGGLGLLSAYAPLQQLGRIILPAFLLLWGGFILASQFTRRI